MSDEVLLLAVGCGRLSGILSIAARHDFVVFGAMGGQTLAALDACPVYLYETGRTIPRRLVAVGNLDKVWYPASDDVAEVEFLDAFRGIFGADWTEVLDVAEKSFDYIAGNNIFFSVSSLKPLKDLTLEQLLENKGVQRFPNIIVS